MMKKVREPKFWRLMVTLLCFVVAFVILAIYKINFSWVFLLPIAYTLLRLGRFLAKE